MTSYKTKIHPLIREKFIIHDGEVIIKSNKKNELPVASFTQLENEKDEIQTDVNQQASKTCFPILESNENVSSFLTKDEKLQNNDEINKDKSSAFNFPDLQAAHNFPDLQAAYSFSNSTNFMTTCEQLLLEMQNANNKKSSSLETENAFLKRQIQALEQQLASVVNFFGNFLATTNNNYTSVFKELNDERSI